MLARNRVPFSRAGIDDQSKTVSPWVGAFPMWSGISTPCSACSPARLHCNQALTRVTGSEVDHRPTVVGSPTPTLTAFRLPPEIRRGMGILRDAGGRADLLADGRDVLGLSACRYRRCCVRSPCMLGGVVQRGSCTSRRSRAVTSGRALARVRVGATKNRWPHLSWVAAFASTGCRPSPS